jgi:hypothetical protein
MRYWKGNEHWMVRDADPDPTYDPQRHTGCGMCGWIDEEGDIEGSDLIWSAGDESNRDMGWWLCMGCD